MTTSAVEDCDGLIARALDEAVAELAAEHGDDPAAWRWSDAHFALMKHQPFSRVPVLNRVFDIRRPAGGGPYTVNRGAYDTSSPQYPYALVHGASLRVIYDFADLEKSRFILTTGQSGNILSPHYDDQATAWRDGGFIAIPTDPAVYGREALGRLELVPGR